MSERLGHSSVAFTLDTYSHVMPGMQPEAAELFMRLVYGSDADESPTQDTAHDTREPADDEQDQEADDDRHM